ncbi:hypothetical protein [Streptomyces sp. URMC 123]|uniref:hypothetical protein n=1 Tax=Streptomyces sp. URMC 123 TaxID=3423403 RepID=UPI003F1D7623
MAGGGFTKLPGGSVVVALSVPRPDGAAGPGPAPRVPDASRVRVLVHAANRQRALTRLRNLGLRAVYLRGNTEPPTPDEITAVLHHPDGLVWRAVRADDTESWHPIGALLRPRPAAPGGAEPAADAGGTGETGETGHTGTQAVSGPARR